MGQEQEIALLCNKLKDGTDTFLNRHLANAFINFGNFLFFLDNIAVMLCRGKPGEPDYWQAYANILLIHMKAAVVFKTPIYTGKLEVSILPILLQFSLFYQIESFSLLIHK